MGTPGWQGSGAHWGPGQLGCACLHVQGPVVQRARPGTMDGFQCALGCGGKQVFLRLWRGLPAGREKGQLWVPGWVHTSLLLPSRGVLELVTCRL